MQMNTKKQQYAPSIMHSKSRMNINTHARKIIESYNIDN